MRKYLPECTLLKFIFAFLFASLSNATTAMADPIGPLMPTTGGTLFKTYEIYHDASDPNVYYAKRTQPVLASAQAGGAIFQMEKFEGQVQRFGGSLTATVALENNTDDFKSDPAWATKDIRSMTFVAMPDDETYAFIRDDRGNGERIFLEPTTDAQNRISFHIPLTATQAERIWQTRTGNTLPITLFLRRHILAVGTDLQVSVSIDYHEIYKYFSANASVGWWVFKASYKQVRESHNIDNFIHVKTFQGVDVTDERLAAAQEEAWKRIKEVLFRQTVTPNPEPTPPLTGWPADILAIANDFYKNYQLATGGGYLTADVVDITKTFDAHYQYDIDQKRQEKRMVSFYYDVDISPLQGDLNRYFFVVNKLPMKKEVSVDTLSLLASKGVEQIKVTLWQNAASTPDRKIDSQTLRFDLKKRTVPPQTVTFHPANTQVIGYDYRVTIGLADQQITGPTFSDSVGTEQLTVPERLSYFYTSRVVDFLTKGARIPVKRADLTITYTRKSDHTVAAYMVRPEKILGNGIRVLASDLDVTIWDCDENASMSYELAAIGADGKFYAATLQNVQARNMVQLSPVATTVAPKLYRAMLGRLASTNSPYKQNIIIESLAINPKK